MGQNLRVCGNKGSRGFIKGRKALKKGKKPIKDAQDLTSRQEKSDGMCCRQAAGKKKS